MRSADLGQRLPSDVHEDWQKVRESILKVSENAERGIKHALPLWTLHLSLSEIRHTTERVVSETGWHFSLAIMSAIEGLFNIHIQRLVSKRGKDATTRALRAKFGSRAKQRERIRFEDMLDELKRADPRTTAIVGKLKDMLKFRHWLAHGRHWSIHYHNCPDPDEVYLLFEALEKYVAFENLN